MDFNYKKYSLNKLEEWLYDCMTAGEATPHEIYDTILNTVQEQHCYYQIGASKTHELLCLLNATNQFNLSDHPNPLNTQNDSTNICSTDDISDHCVKSWNSFWENEELKEDKVVKWQLPVQQKIEEGIDDYYVQFPDDLLEAANLKEGDQIEWVDNGDGSYILRKVNVI